MPNGSTFRQDVHISYAGFGVKDNEWEHLLDFADRFEDRIRSRSFNAYDRQMVLRELYDETFNIQRHDETNPDLLSLVAMSPRENIYEYSAYYNAIRRYRILRVNEKFGLSLIEYMELPRDVVELISKILEAEIKASPQPKDIGTDKFE